MKQLSFESLEKVQAEIAKMMKQAEDYTRDADYPGDPSEGFFREDITLAFIAGWKACHRHRIQND